MIKKFIFAIILLLLILIAVFFVAINPVAKFLAEKQLTETHGAEVNLDSLDIDFFDRTITINNIQATNAARATHNIGAVEKLTARWLYKPLLQRNLIIETVDISGLSVDGEREKPGRVLRAAKSLPKPSIISEKLKAILSTAEFQQIDLIKTKLRESTQSEITVLEDEIKNLESDWKNKIKQLPENLNIKKKKDHYKNFGDLDNFAKIIQIKNIKKDLKQDKRLIKSYQQQLKEDQGFIQQRLKQLRALPRDQLNTASQLLGIDSRRHGLTQLLQEDDVQYFLELVKNTLFSEPEQNDAPAEESPLNWQIDELSLNGTLWRNTPINLSAESINMQTTATNPLKFLLEGGPSGSAIYAKGLLDQKNTNGELVIDIAELPIENLKARIDDSLVLNILSIISALDGELRLSDDTVNINLNATFSQLAIELANTGNNASNSDKMSALMTQLGKLKDIRFNLAIEGSPTKPKIRLRSNLDKVIKSLVEYELQTQLKAYQDELGNELLTKIDRVNLKTQALGDNQKHLDIASQEIEKFIKKHL